LGNNPATSYPMSEAIIRSAVRAKFAITSRDAACSQIRRLGDKYLELAGRLAPTSGATVVTVPAMQGVDEDMRSWSYWMLLEHNAIVNRSMTEIVCSLAEDREPGPAAQINPKTDVLPDSSSGLDQVDAFQRSIDDHLRCVPTLGKLKGTATRPHPVFGDFDAHQWHCMLGFHLMIHFKQARLIVRQAVED
jgi:hypothetical protein